MLAERHVVVRDDLFYVCIYKKKKRVVTSKGSLYSVT